MTGKTVSIRLKAMIPSNHENGSDPKAPPPSAFTLILAIGALLFLVPATFGYLAGMFILLVGFFQTNKNGFAPAFLVLAAILLVPGYGLYSLWWLVIKSRKVTFATIPLFIYGGLIAGALTALLFIFPFLRLGLSPLTPYITHYDNFATMLMFGGGPLLLLITLLLWLRFRRK